MMMSSAVISGAAILVLAGAPILPSALNRNATGATLSAPDLKALEEGQILVHMFEMEGSPVKKAVAVTLIDATPETIFAALGDYKNFPKFMAYVTRVDVAKSAPPKTQATFYLDFPWPIGDRFYTIELTDQMEDYDGTKVYTSRWQYVAGSGNINDTKGSWEVVAYGQKKSLVRYTVFTDPGGKLPTWARNQGTSVGVPKVLNGFRDYVRTL